MGRSCSVVIAYVFVFMARLLSPNDARAEATGEITGRVRAIGDVAAPDAVVQIVDLHLLVPVDRNGGFRAQGLPPGDHRLMATSSRYGAASEAFRIQAGSTTDVTIQLSPLYQDEVVVSAGGGERTRSESYQAVGALGGEVLEARQQPSLGQTIAKEPGVSSTYFGPAVGRPVLRGLGGDRVRVLTDGTDVGDLSSIAPDHAVDAEVVLADRVEILRGAATLMYGSSAVGGVVNVIDDRIPTSILEKELTGSVSASAGTVANERRESALLDGHFGRMAWHFATLRRNTDDYDIPGFAGLANVRRPGDRKGVLLNSASESASSTLGLSWIGDSGFAGIAAVGSSRVDLQACKLEYSIVSPK